MADDDAESRSDLRGDLDAAKREVEELGGWEGFRSGEWLPRLIQRAFRVYYERATVDDLRAKYNSSDTDFIARKLVRLATSYSALLGAVVGVAVTTDEVVAIATGGEGGVGLPANVAIAAAAIMAEAISLVRIQLKLVANLAKLYGVPLDHDDPEDLLTILAFALGGSAAEVAGKFSMKVGSKATQRVIRSYVSKETLKAIQAVGRKIGVKILQRTIMKYAIPLVSVAIGAGWNYAATRTVASVATRHLLARSAERASCPLA